jgi:NADH-quinone oxidoreductase subunit L
MCRLYFLTFWGDFRGWTVGRPSLWSRTELAAKMPERTDAPHAEDDHGTSAKESDEDDADAAHHGADDLTMPGYAPHESPWQMTVPLILLATFSVFAGWLNPGFHFEKQPMEHWLHPVFESVEQAILVGHNDDKQWASQVQWPLALGGLGAFAFGSILAWWMYIAKKGAPAKRIAEWQPGLYRLVLDKWRVDELYDATVIAAVDSLAETSAAFDKTIVDGIIARLTALLVSIAGTVLRAFQTGVVHVYAATMVVGLAVTGWFFAVPHANATVVDAGNDDYVVTAAPGVGYAYRWDSDSDGKPDKADFGADTTVKLHLEPGKSQTVGLEVRNALGLVRRKNIHVAHPQEPTSSL